MWLYCVCVFICVHIYYLRCKKKLKIIVTVVGLHGNVLDLVTRLDIAIDVAHAVTYLHMYTGLCLVAVYFI